MKFILGISIAICILVASASIGGLVLIYSANEKSLLKNPNIEPIQIVKNALLWDMTEDGGLSLVYFANATSYGITLSPRGIKEHGNSAEKSSLKVVKTEDWSEVAKSPIEHEIRLPFNQFIPHEDSVFISSVKFGGVADEKRDDVIWNYQAGTIKECLSHSVEEISNFKFVDRSLAIGTMQVPGKYRTWKYRDHLIKLKYPSCEIEVGDVVDPSEKYEGGFNYVQLGSLQISPDKRQFVYVTGGLIITRDIETFAIQSVVDIGQLEVIQPTGITYSPDGKYLLVLEQLPYYRRKNTDNFFYVVVYEPETIEELRRFPVGGMDNIAVSPDGRYVAVGEKATRKDFFGSSEQARIGVYDFETGKKVSEVAHKWEKEERDDPFKTDIRSILFAPDGKNLMTTTRDIYVWNFEEIIKGSK